MDWPRSKSSFLDRNQILANDGMIFTLLADMNNLFRKNGAKAMLTMIVVDVERDFGSTRQKISTVNSTTSQQSSCHTMYFC